MGLIDSMKRPLRVRFTDDSDDESKTAFLKETESPAKNGTVIAARRSLYWTLYAFMLSTLLLLSVIAIQNRKIVTEYWSQDVLQRGAPKRHEFVTAYDYTEPDSLETRALYSKYFRGGLIGLPIQNPARYGLPPGYPSKKDKSIEVYLPSYNHQLHCLIMTREAWWDLRNKYANKTSTTAGSEPVDDFPETQKQHWDHVEHCMDYLRQMILCNADTTLEAPVEYEDGQRSNTDGMNVWRKCYDIDYVFEQYQDHHVEFDLVKPWKCPGGSKHGKCLPVT